jgi:hypothetical protein
MFSIGLLGDGVLFVVGLYWCRVMFGRWKSDLDDFRTSEGTSSRAAIAILWVVTAFILVFLLDTSVGVLRSLWGLV